jgi:hypothetical protein
MKKSGKNVSARSKLLLCKEVILVLSGVHLTEVKAGVGSGSHCGGISDVCDPTEEMLHVFTA